MMNNNPNHILVVANGESPSSSLFHRLLKEHSKLVAVDGGLHSCLCYNVEPDILIGDFDSISEDTRSQLSKTLQIHTPDQGKSDLEKALEYLFHEANDATAITVCGALGKRLDHTLTNMCLLCRYPGKVKFETDTEWSMALPRSYTFTSEKGQLLSLIAMGAPAQGVVTQGLKWELKGATLNKSFVSISNVCLGKLVSITFTSGDLVACLAKEEISVSI